MAASLSVKSIFECRPVLVSLAIPQVWVKVINEVIVRVVQPKVKKAWTVVHASCGGGTTLVHTIVEKK